MSILIQFIKDNMALFVLTMIAAALMIGAIAALIVFTVKQKRAAKRSEKISDVQPTEREIDRQGE